MEEVRNKLQVAIDKGFIPADLEAAMQARDHEGSVWLVAPRKSKELEDGNEESEDTIGIGYKMLLNDESTEEDGPFESHIHWYSLKEAQALLEGIDE